MAFELSCGGIIFKDKKFLLLKYGWGHWGFVKGKVEKGEKIEETFFREAEEEAGLKRENLKLIEGFKEKINYFYKREGETIYKEVIYLLAESNTFYVKLSYEHTDFAWLDYEDAIDKITYENDKKVLRKAYEFICQNLNSE